jgi:hypothetical protein
MKRTQAEFFALPAYERAILNMRYDEVHAKWWKALQRVVKWEKDGSSASRLQKARDDRAAYSKELVSLQDQMGITKDDR